MRTKAQKEHRCDTCGGLIPINTLYFRRYSNATRHHMACIQPPTDAPKAREAAP